MGLFNFMKKKESDSPEEPELERALVPEPEQGGEAAAEEPKAEPEAEEEGPKDEQPVSEDAAADEPAREREEEAFTGPRIKVLSKDQIAKSEESGKILTYLIERHHEMKSRDSLMTVLRGLEGTRLWVPMHVLVSKRDLEAMKAATKDKPAKPKDPIRFKNDTLKNRDGARLYPAFTTRDEIPEEYRKRFQWVQMDAGVCGLEVIKRDDLSALIINPFTKNLALTKERLSRLIRPSEEKVENEELALAGDARFLS